MCQLERIASIALAVALLVTGCTNGESSSELPDWIPDEIGGLTISPADVAEPKLAAHDAIATVRAFMLSRLNAIPEQEPEAVLARITGTVFGEKPVRVPPGRFPKVRNRLAWLVVWRQVPEDAFDPPFHTPVSDEPVDYIVFVDAVTGERLYNVFAPLGPG